MSDHPPKFKGTVLLKPTEGDPERLLAPGAPIAWYLHDEWVYGWLLDSTSCPEQEGDECWSPYTGEGSVSRTALYLSLVREGKVSLEGIDRAQRALSKHNAYANVEFAVANIVRSIERQEPVWLADFLKVLLPLGTVRILDAKGHDLGGANE